MDLLIVVFIHWSSECYSSTLLSVGLSPDIATDNGVEVLGSFNETKELSNIIRSI